MNAIALNSTIFNAARIIGPALAGIVMATIGAGTAFLINGLSYIAVIFALFRINAAKTATNKSSGDSVLAEAMAGLKYIAKTPVLYITLLLSMILSVFSQNFNTLIPTLAKNVLNQKEMGYGFLMSAMGIGALIGALSLAMTSRRKAKYRSFLIGGGIMGLFVLMIGFQNNYILSCILLTGAGWGMVVFNANANNIIQINSPDKMRGRIMSALMLASGGMIPVGSLYAGYIAEQFGSSFTYRLSGAIGVAAIMLTAVYYYGIQKKKTGN